MRLSLLALGLATLTLTACDRTADQRATAESPVATAPAPAGSAPSTQPSAGAPAAGATIRGRVIETLQAGSYTYVQVDTGSGTAWAAAPGFEVAPGAEVVFSSAMPMRGYKSETLNRTFDVVYFTEAIQTLGGATPMSNEENLAVAHARTQVKATDASSVDGIAKAEGGYRVNELYADADALAGRDVIVRGRVVKYTAEVMGKNWIHVQDGSGQGPTADLTVTSQDSVKVGDLVVVRGKLETDMDLGYGYSYRVIVQDASLTVESGA